MSLFFGFFGFKFQKIAKNTKINEKLLNYFEIFRKMCENNIQKV